MHVPPTEVCHTHTHTHTHTQREEKEQLAHLLDTLMIALSVVLSVNQSLHGICVLCAFIETREFKIPVSSWYVIYKIFLSFSDPYI